MVVWIAISGSSPPDWPVIRVSKSHKEYYETKDVSVFRKDNIIVTICDEPEILVGEIEYSDCELVKKFIKLNKDALIDYWNYYIEDVFDFYERMKKI